MIVVYELDSVFSDSGPRQFSVGLIVDLHRLCLPRALIMLAIVFFALTMLLAEGVTAGGNSSRHVTYNVQQLYQACPPPGRVVVNGPSGHVDELTEIKQELKLLKTKVASHQVKIARLEGASNQSSVPAGCAGRNITRPNGGLPADCSEIYKLGGRATGVYVIKPRDAPRPFRVLCELTLDGGWTVIMRRFNGSVDFYRKWTDYKNGFGSVDGEHWLGNDNIHWLTSQMNYKMQVDMRYWANKISYYASYDRFTIENEAAKYKMNIAGYRGNVGYDGMSVHNGKPFSTWDRDNDVWPGHCAQTFKGAFWHTNCHSYSLPTGMYKASCGGHDCIEWKSTQALDQILMKVKQD